MRGAWKLVAVLCVATTAALTAVKLSGEPVRTAAENRASCELVKGSITDSPPPLAYLQILRQLASDGQHATNNAINSAAEALKRSLPQNSAPTSYSTVNWNEATAARTEIIAACNSLGIGPYVSPPHT